MLLCMPVPAALVPSTAAGINGAGEVETHEGAWTWAHDAALMTALQSLARPGKARQDKNHARPHVN